MAIVTTEEMGRLLSEFVRKYAPGAEKMSAPSPWSAAAQQVSAMQAAQAPTAEYERAMSALASHVVPTPTPFMQMIQTQSQHGRLAVASGQTLPDGSIATTSGWWPDDYDNRLTRLQLFRSIDAFLPDSDD